MSGLNSHAVRETAERYARRHLANIDHGDILDEMLTDPQFAHLMTGDEDQDIATLDPIAAEIKDRAKAAALSWPDKQPTAGHAYPDSHSPWSQWLTQQLIDHEWTSSGLVEASGHAFDLKQVSRWLHSQDVPEPWAAVLAAKAFGASVIDALRAAEHGVMVDAVLEEAAQPTAEQDGDVRAVRALTNATGRMLTKWSEANEAVRREMWTEVHDRADAVDERFRERFAELDAAQVALDARDAETETAVHGLLGDLGKRARDAKAEVVPTTGWILWDADGRWLHATTSPIDDGWRAVSINEAEAQEWRDRSCLLDSMDEAGWRAYNDGDKARWQFDPGSRDVWLKAKLDARDADGSAS